MDFIWNSITDWLKEVLVSGIVSNLSGMFDSTNEQIGQIAGQVGLTPQAWNSGIFNMIQNLSNNVILPLAGAILAVVMTLELIQLMPSKPHLCWICTLAPVQSLLAAEWICAESRHISWKKIWINCVYSAR